jgi:uncharacterized membrane protein YebE (DUF533 family)
MTMKHLYIAAAAVAAYLAYRWWKKHQTAAAVPTEEAKPGANATAAGA